MSLQKHVGYLNSWIKPSSAQHKQLKIFKYKCSAHQSSIAGQRPRPLPHPSHRSVRLPTWDFVELVSRTEGICTLALCWSWGTEGESRGTWEKVCAWLTWSKAWTSCCGHIWHRHSYAIHAHVWIIIVVVIFVIDVVVVIVIINYLC